MADSPYVGRGHKLLNGGAPVTRKRDEPSGTEVAEILAAAGPGYVVCGRCWQSATAASMAGQAYCSPCLDEVRGVVGSDASGGHFQSERTDGTGYDDPGWGAGADVEDDGEGD